MPFQLSPGVNVTEIDLTTIVPAVATSVGAIAGIFNWGPVNERVLVDSETALVNVFGKPNSNNAETWFTAANFLGYTNSLYVVRAANTTATYKANDFISSANVSTGNTTINQISNTSGLNQGMTVSSAGYLATGTTVASIVNSTAITVSSAPIGTQVGASLEFYNVAANTTAAAKNAYANVGSVANTPVVLNNVDFVGKYGLFDTDVYYVARYPGAAGNSLKISVCDSPNAYSSNLNMVANADVSAVLTANIGSNVITVTVSSVSGNATAANNFAAALSANLTIGDQLGLGNSSLGIQYAQVSAISSVSGNTFTINTYDPYRLAANLVANSTSTNTVARHWEFYNVVSKAPGTSDFVLNFGNNAAVDTMHVVVADENGWFTGQPGTVLETFVDVSRANDAKTVGGQINYYQTVINNTSNFIWAVNDRSGAASANAFNVVSSTNQAALTLSMVGGSDGYTEATAPLQTIASGYQLFASAEDVDISLVLQGKPINGSTSSGGFTVSNFQLANWLIDNIAEPRKDCVVFITPDDAVTTGNPGNEASAITAWRNVIHDSSYAVMDSGYKYQYDRYNDINRYLPTNGDIAGLCARTDNTRDPWWSPAGFNRGQIKNVIKMRYNPRHSARDLLYKNGVNSVVSFPGQGTVLYGDKTLQTKPSAFDRINVRRLFIVLEKAISTAAKFTLFEFNDAFTQAQFKNLVTPYLRDVQGRRGITDFLVVCDGTNNTPVVVDSNQFVGDIYIKPARSINFIQLNFVAVATGVQFSEVVGKF